VSRLRREPLSVDEAHRAVDHPSAGAIVVFSGVVRDHHEGRVVTRLDYEAYDAMADKEIDAILRDIEAKHQGARAFAVHRLGELNVGDAAVVCAVSTPHRAEAYALCRELIDRIKANVPIWKREWGPGGAVWIGWEDARCTPDHRHDA
jgi:molybdopterin synthase catalytic subunit